MPMMASNVSRALGLLGPRIPGNRGGRKGIEGPSRGMQRVARCLMYGAEAWARHFSGYRPGTRIDHIVCLRDSVGVLS